MVTLPHPGLHLSTQEWSRVKISAQIIIRNHICLILVAVRAYRGATLGIISHVGGFA